MEALLIVAGICIALFVYRSMFLSRVNQLADDAEDALYDMLTFEPELFEHIAKRLSATKESRLRAFFDSAHAKLYWFRTVPKDRLLEAQIFFLLENIDEYGWANLDEYAGTAEWIEANRFRLRTLSEEELSDAIRLARESAGTIEALVHNERDDCPRCIAEEKLHWFYFASRIADGAPPDAKRDEESVDMNELVPMRT